MESAIRIVVAFFPLALVPPLLHLIAHGQIDLGGGEKDLVWLIPWALWSLLFAGSSLVLWRRGWPLSRSIARSAIVGLAGLVLVAVVLALIGHLGIAGRF